MDDTRKIGFGLSAAGVLFTVLGVMLFFDRGLLGLGNVSSNHSASISANPVRCSASAVRASSMLMDNCSALARTVAFSLRCLADDGPEEDRAILFSGTQVEGHHLLPRRHLARALRVGIHRHHSRRLGLSEPLWRFFSHGIVRVLLSLTSRLRPTLAANARSLARRATACLLVLLRSNSNLRPSLYACFFAFWRRGVMRNLPVIGTFLNLRPVRAVTDRLIAKSRLPL